MKTKFLKFCKNFVKMSFPDFGGVAKLEQYGMHFDDLNRIRVLDEDTSNQVILIFFHFFHRVKLFLFSTL